MAVVKSDIIVIKNVISELRVEMRSGFDRVHRRFARLEKRIEVVEGGR